MDKNFQITNDQLDIFFESMSAILNFDTFEESARLIFDNARKIIGAKSGYIALLSEDGKNNEVLFLESGGVECTVDPSLPMPIRGLRADAYRENKCVYDNDFMNSNWIKFLPNGHMSMKNVLFAPLVLQNKTVGIMGLANKKEGFNEKDAYYASIFGKIASISLYNSQNIEKKNNSLIALQKSLDEVKTLKSLLPICANCKKIRNDEDDGYWEQLEEYISSHSQTEFTHSICPDCANLLYGDFIKPEKEKEE